MKNINVKNEFADFFGIDPNISMTKTYTYQLMHKYIEDNNLELLIPRTMIQPDESLKKLLRITDNIIITPTEKKNGTNNF